MLVRNRVSVVSTAATAGCSIREASSKNTATKKPLASSSTASQGSPSSSHNVNKATTAPTTARPAPISSNPFSASSASPMSLASLGSLFKMSQEHELLPRRCGPRHNPILEISNNESTTQSARSGGGSVTPKEELQQVGETEKRKLFGGFDFPEIPPRKKADYRTTTQQVKDMFNHMLDPKKLAEDEEAIIRLKQQEEEQQQAANAKKGKGKKSSAKGGGSGDGDSMLVDLFKATPEGNRAAGAKKKRISADELQEGLDPSKGETDAGINTTLDEMRTRMAMRKLMGLHFHTYGRQRELESIERRRENTLNELTKGESLYYRVHTRQEIEDHLRTRQAAQNDDSPLPSVIESAQAREERVRKEQAQSLSAKKAVGKESNSVNFVNAMETLAQRRKRKMAELDTVQSDGKRLSVQPSTTTSNANIFEYSLDSVTSDDVFTRTNLFPQTENHIVVKTPLMRMLEERQKRKQQNAFMENMKGSSAKGLQVAIARTGQLGPDPRDQARLPTPSNTTMSPLLPEEEIDENQTANGGGVKESYRIASSSATAGFDPVAALRSINNLTGGKGYKGAQAVIVQDGTNSGAVNERFFTRDDFVNRGQVGRVSQGASREIVAKHQQSTKGARQAAAAAAAAAANDAAAIPAAVAGEEYIDDGVNAGLLEDEWDEDDKNTAFTPDMNLLGKKKDATAAAGASGSVSAALRSETASPAKQAQLEEEEDLEAAITDDSDVPEESTEDVIATMKRLRREEEEELAALAKAEAAHRKGAGTSSLHAVTKGVAHTAGTASRKAVSAAVKTASGKKK